MGYWKWVYSGFKEAKYEIIFLLGILGVIPFTFLIAYVGMFWFEEINFIVAFFVALVYIFLFISYTCYLNNKDIYDERELKNE